MSYFHHLFPKSPCCSVNPIILLIRNGSVCL